MVAVLDGVKVGTLVCVANWSGVKGSVAVGNPFVPVGERVGKGVKVASIPSTVGNEVMVTGCDGNVGIGPGAIK